MAKQAAPFGVKRTVSTRGLRQFEWLTADGQWASSQQLAQLFASREAAYAFVHQVGAENRSASGRPNYNTHRFNQQGFRPIRAGETMLQIVGGGYQPNPTLEAVPAR